MTPNLIHWVWTGSNPIPTVLRSAMKSWKDKHPDWDFTIWYPPMLEALEMQNRELYGRAKELAPNDWLRWRSDIARLEILHRHGGVYTDTDCEAIQSLSGLPDLGDGDMFLPQSPNDLSGVTNAVMGSPAGHPFLKHLLDSIADNALSFRSGARLVETVGGKFITREIKSARPDNVVVYPWWMFAGQSIRDRERGKAPDLSNCFVNHKYDNTFKLRSNPGQISAWREAADILNGAGIRFWLCAGSVLGHVREGRFLPTDKDVDLGVWAEDRERVSQAFRDHRLQVTRDRPHQINVSVGGVKIDIHCHYFDGNATPNKSVYFDLHYKGKVLRHRYPEWCFGAGDHTDLGLAPTVFYLKETLLPNNIEEYLTIHYGEDWQTPKSGWKWYSSARNMEVLPGGHR